MSGLEYAAIIGAMATLLGVIGGGVWKVVSKAIELWDKAMVTKDTQNAELRDIREDALAQAVGEAKAEAIAARLAAEGNRELLQQLLTEWSGR